MSVRLQVLFLRLGLAVVAILFLFHLYLRENRAVGQARWQTARWHQLKGGEWGAPAVSRLTMPDSGDISLQRLASLKKRTHNDTSRMGVATSVGVVNGLVEDDVLIQESIGEKENDRNLTKLASPDYQPTNLIEESSLNLTNRFLLDPSLSLPTPRATLSLSLLSHCQWLADLRHHLTTLPPSSHHLSLVSSDSKYLEVLLNWLISALVSSAKPLTNVLVLSLDHALCQLLGQREIPCVHIPPSCLLRHGLSLTHHVPFTEVHIMRLLVMRLLNNWGYDVANYDSDAVVLRNPEVRYGELGDMDLIGSVGHFPHELDHRWGTAVCIGVVLIRASPQTGQLRSSHKYTHTLTHSHTHSLSLFFHLLVPTHLLIHSLTHSLTPHPSPCLSLAHTQRSTGRKCLRLYQKLPMTRLVSTGPWMPWRLPGTTPIATLIR